MTIQHPGGPASTREERRRKSIASSFKRSDHHEMLLVKKAQAEAGNVVAHQLIEGLSPLERTSFGSYQAAREAAVAEGLIDAETGGAEVSAKPETLADAEMAQAKALEDLREASAAADRLAAQQWQRRDERRRSWATKVLAEASKSSAALIDAERVAERAFRAAAVTGLAVTEYLAWMDARISRNLDRDRTVQARAILGHVQDDTGYPITDTPSYGDAVDQALAAEVSARMGQRSGDLTLELNALDR